MGDRWMIVSVSVVVMRKKKKKKRREMHRCEGGWVSWVVGKLIEGGREG
jgi:hypothetical protein